MTKNFFLLSHHYKESNIFYLLMPQKIYQFKAEGSEIKPNPLCLENISKDFAVNDMKKRIK